MDRFAYQLTSDAEQEYQKSYAWYEEKQENLGLRFALSVRKKIQTISINPYLFSKKKGRYHEASLDKPFPFIIVYIVDKKQKLVVVTSIFHTSRNPKMKYKAK